MKRDLIDMACWSRWLGVLPPRLLQDHSLSGETLYTALVQSPIGSGEHLVNSSEPNCRLGLAHIDTALFQALPRSNELVANCLIPITLR